MSETTWQEDLAKSTTLKDRAGKANKQAGALLWSGAKAAINEWLDTGSNDTDGERLHAGVLEALGTSRKGDASKIRTVALAVLNAGLDLDQPDTNGKPLDNLSKAYAEATRLTKTVKVHAAEDEAADTATSVIAANAPKTASKPEGAAMIVLSGGVDEAARLLLAALGTDNHAAHKAFLRAVAQEAAGLIPKPEPKPKAEPKPKGAAKKSTAKPASEKAAPAAAKTKAKPVKKAAAKPVEEPVEEDVFEDPEVEAPETDDMFADLDDDETEVEETPAPAKKAAKPVRRGPVRR